LTLLKGSANTEKSVSGNSKNKLLKSWFETKAELSQIQMLYDTGAKRFLAGQENER